MTAPTPALTLLAGRPGGEADPALLARAEAALTPAERVQCARYTFPKRRRDWLLGRLAAKDAACLALGAPTSVEIVSAPSGAPCLATPDALAGWHLSITHGHGRAGAVVAPGPVGIDLEAMRSVPENGWRFFLTPEERAWVSGGALGPQGDIVFWALKEAAYKVLAGAVSGVLSLTVAEAEGGVAVVRHPEGAIAGRWVVGGGFCLAVAAHEADAAWLGELALPAP